MLLDNLLRAQQHSSWANNSNKPVLNLFQRFIAHKRHSLNPALPLRLVECCYPWTPLYFSDLSSVRYTSSGERSFPTPPGFMQLKSVHERYSQELPPLRAIHEEHQGFIPVHPIRDSPRVVPQHRLNRNARFLPPRHARLVEALQNQIIQIDPPKADPVQVVLAAKIHLNRTKVHIVAAHLSNGDCRPTDLLRRHLHQCCLLHPLHLQVTGQNWLLLHPQLLTTYTRQLTLAVQMDTMNLIQVRQHLPLQPQLDQGILTWTLPVPARLKGRATVVLEVDMTTSTQESRL